MLDATSPDCSHATRVTELVESLERMVARELDAVAAVAAPEDVREIAPGTPEPPD